MYDEFVFSNDPHKKFKFRAGEERLRRDLIKEFPGEIGAIDEWFRWTGKAKLASTLLFYAKVLPTCLFSLLWPLLNFYMRRAGLHCTTQGRYTYLIAFLFAASHVFTCISDQDILNKLPTTCSKLKEVLSGQWGDMGLPPDKLSWLAHSGCFNHFSKGGFYPKGGSSSIARHLIQYINRRGGAVLTRACVERVVVSDNQAVGVQVAKGSTSFFIPCKTVVSSAGALNTFTPGNLIETSVFEENTHLQRLANLVNSSASGAATAHMYAFVTLKGSAEELNLPSQNLWHLPQMDLNEDAKKRPPDEQEHEEVPRVAFINFASARDGSWNDRSMTRS